MATRRERVVLDLEDNFTAGVARAAVQTGILKKELNDLSGHSVRASRDLDKTSTSTKKVGDESRKAGPDIDKFSGRLRTLADAALILGPALIPIGASAIPALTGALAGLGAAAGALGVTVLAFKGIGDGLKALDAYQLEPTAENLAKLRLEMEKLGPAGAQFVHFIDDLEPKLSDLQNVARQGLFPGIESGIEDLLTRLPLVRQVVNRVSQEMGRLAADSGQALASDQWTPFFEYLRREAAPIMDDFGRATGNVILGLSNLLVAFDPLTKNFTSGLLDMSRAFADWSAHLDTNEGFQNFLNYVREQGPKALDFLSSLIDLFGGLVKAAAPWGNVLLPALTAVTDVLATISNSPIGPTLYTAAAGMIAFNRAASLTEKTTAKLTTSLKEMSSARFIQGSVAGLGLFAAGMTDLDEKAGLANTTMFTMAGLMVGGPWGAAVGAGVGLVADLAAANDDLEASITRANEAMASNNVPEMRRQYDELNRQIHEAEREINSSTRWGGQHDGIMGQFKDAWGALGTIVTGGLGDAKDTLDELGGHLGHTTREVGLFSTGVLDAADAVRNLSGALAGLQGWLDKRAAIRDYRDSLKELGKAVKDDFQPKDAETLDAVGENIIKVAQAIKDPRLQSQFMKGAVASLEQVAGKSGPKAQAQIQRLINKMTQLGLVKADPKIDADAKGADGKINETKGKLRDLDGSKAIPKLMADNGAAKRTIAGTKGMLDDLDGTTAHPNINVNPGNSLGIIGAIEARLNSLHDRTISITTINRSVSGGATPRPTQNADGGVVPKTGLPYADRHLYLLADGERIISNRSGQADSYAGVLEGINRNLPPNLIKGMLADGGTAGNRRPTAHATMFTSEALADLLDSAHSAAQALKILNQQLKEQQKAYDQAKKNRDDAVSRRDNLASSITQGLGGDIWAASSGSVWAAGAHGANSPQGAMAALNAQKARAQRLVAAINTLKAKGITGPVLAEIIGSGDVDRAEAMAALDIGTLTSFATTYTDTQSTLAAAGLAGGNAAYGDDVRSTTRELKAQLHELREIKQAIKDAEKANDKAHDRNADKVTAGVNGAASSGHRHGKGGHRR